MRLLTLGLFLAFLALLGGNRVVSPIFHNIIPSAEAVVGRPLTPMSYAGVARRTSRRCAAGVYYC
jgi:hypothetical protein